MKHRYIMSRSRSNSAERLSGQANRSRDPTLFDYLLFNIIS